MPDAHTVRSPPSIELRPEDDGPEPRALVAAPCNVRRLFGLGVAPA